MALNPAIFIAVAIILASLFIFISKKKNAKKTALSLVGKGKLTTILKERQRLSHDTYNFVFKLPRDDLTFGVPLGNHYIIQAKIILNQCQNIKINSSATVDGEEVTRKYTPTSVVSQIGTFEQVIKIYRPNSHPRFPEGGKLTPYLENLPIGSEVVVTGPHGHLEYFGSGKTTINRIIEGGNIQKKNFKKFYMIAGGTGITPMYQLIQAVCNDNNDKVELHLLYANKTEEDILLREELEKYEKTGKVKVYYTLDTPAEGWKHFGGFVTIDMVKQCFKDKDDSILCCSCGPLPMTNLARKLFLELGFKEDQIYRF